jgi:hypothetical protein
MINLKEQQMRHGLFFSANFLMFFLFLASAGADDRGKLLWGQLPKNFDPIFAPKNIDPDTATISPSPGFEQGRYAIHILYTLLFIRPKWE